MLAIGKRQRHCLRHFQNRDAALFRTRKSAGDGAEAGFTLIELLVALAITALLAGIAFPALQNQLKQSARAEARMTLALVLAQAHADAISAHKPVRVSLSPDRRELQSSSGRMAKVLPPNTELEWPEAGFVFFADGSANGGNGAIATLGGAADKSAGDSGANGVRTNQFAVDAATSRIVFNP